MRRHGDGTGTWQPRNLGLGLAAGDTHRTAPLTVHRHPDFTVDGSQNERQGRCNSGRGKPPSLLSPQASSAQAAWPLPRVAEF